MQNCNCHNHSQVHFKDYFSENIYTWCTNCGNYGIHAAVARRFYALISAVMVMDLIKLTVLDFTVFTVVLFHLLAAQQFPIEK